MTENTTQLSDVQRYQEQLEVAKLKQMISIIESIPAFARDSDEADWKGLSAPKDGLYDEFSLSELQAQAEKLYYTNPSARGIIDTMVNFVIGKDCTITPVDPDPEVLAYWQLFCEVNNLDLRIREFGKRTFLKGESFIRIFEPELFAPNKDRTPHHYYKDIPVWAPVQQLRFIEPAEITDTDGTHSYGVQTNSEDIEEVISYIRKKPISSSSFVREEIPADEIIHTKILVDSNVKRGISLLVGIAEYMVKYRDWLEDRISLNKLRTLFNLIMKVTGTGGAAALKNTFEDKTLSTASTAPSSTIDKKLPKRGSVLVSSPNVEYEFLSPKVDAQDTAADGRAIDLMLAKGTALTEYVVRGDASNANYSSSMVSESPMVRMFQAYQDLLEKPIMAIYRKVIRFGIENDILPKTTKKVLVTLDPITQKETIKEEETATDHRCSVAFEALIHRDLLNEANAYAIHQEKGWDSQQGITAKVGNDHSKVQKERRLEKTELDKDDAAESDKKFSAVNSKDKSANAQTPAHDKVV